MKLWANWFTKYQCITLTLNLSQIFWHSNLAYSVNVNRKFLAWLKQPKLLQSPRMLSVKAVGNQMVPPCVEWWYETTTSFSYCPSTAFLPLWPHCANARQNRCQEDLNRFPFGELEETTRTPSYYGSWMKSSKTWDPITSPWMKQLMWLRIVHSGVWCLALQAPGVPEKNEWNTVGRCLARQRRDDKTLRFRVNTSLDTKPVRLSLKRFASLGISCRRWFWNVCSSVCVKMCYITDSQWEWCTYVWVSNVSQLMMQRTMQFWWWLGLAVTHWSRSTYCSYAWLDGWPFAGG